MADLRIRDFTEFVTLQGKSANFEEQVTRMGELFGQWRGGLPCQDSMYGAVITQLLDHYCNPLTPMEDSELFYKRLYYLEFTALTSDGRWIERMIIVMKVLWKLLKMKKNSDPKLPFVLESA